MASPTDVSPRSTGTRRWVVACVLAAAGTGLTACGSSDGATPDAPPASFGADSWVDAVTAAEDGAGATADRRTVGTTVDGRPHAVMDLDASGRLLASRITGRSARDPLGTPHVGWLGAGGFAPLPYDDDASAGRQVTAADHDGGDVAWVETSSTDPNLFDWTVWASDGDGRSRVDASTRLGPADEQRRVFGQTEPDVSGSRVAWAADTGTGDGPAASVLVTGTDAPRDRTGGTDAATLPALVDDTLYLVRSPRAGTGASGTTRVVARDLGTGREETVAEAALQDPRALTRLVATSRHVAWVVSDPEAARSTLHVLDLRSGRTRGVRLHHAGLQTMALSLSDDLVAWGNGSAEGDAGAYVMQLDDGRVWRLHDEPGYSVAMVAGDTVAWADVADDDPAATADFVVARWTGRD